MITQNRYDLGDMSYQGLSTDTKPALAPVNSLFLELDTKTLYYCAKSGSQSEEAVAEWVKYGEAPSGGIVGDLSEGVTIRESDWIEDDDGYHVEVEPYVLNSGVQYTLYLSDSGGDTSDTATAFRDELERRYTYAVFFRDSIKITNDSEEGRTFVYGQHNQEITLRIEKHGGRE